MKQDHQLTDDKSSDSNKSEDLKSFAIPKSEEAELYSKDKPIKEPPSEIGYKLDEIKNKEINTNFEGMLHSVRL